MDLDSSSLRRALLKENGPAKADPIPAGGKLGDPQKEAARELSAYDQHTADQGTETFEREKDWGLLEQARATLAQIDRALSLMDEGKYGICLDCGAHIDTERLHAIPYALRCLACEQAEEEAQKHRPRRPVEEEALFPPFSRTFFDGQDQAAYDGEDAWQDVARYGTANSPQDVPGSLDFGDAWIDADEKTGASPSWTRSRGDGELEDPQDDLTVADWVAEEERSELSTERHEKERTRGKARRGKAARSQEKMWYNGRRGAPSARPDSCRRAMGPCDTCCSPRP